MMGCESENAEKTGGCRTKICSTTVFQGKREGGEGEKDIQNPLRRGKPPLKGGGFIVGHAEEGGCLGYTSDPPEDEARMGWPFTTAPRI